MGVGLASVASISVYMNGIDDDQSTPDDVFLSLKVMELMPLIVTWILEVTR